jgi:hypothetical protein
MAGLRIDHIVYATLDVDKSVEHLAALMGIRSTAGGRHIGMGTHNYLLGLGDGAYLEVIGPDPTQTVPPGHIRPFGIDVLDGPKLAGFGVKAPNIDEVVTGARRAGYDPGDVHDLQRATPDGGLLAWRLTFGSSHHGLVPFLIDWRDSIHPSSTSPPGCRLVSLRAEHPDPETVRRSNQALGFDLEVTKGPAAALVATIDTPAGRVELR